ncbi:MAG: hypothetical protein H0U67_11870 [Gemmatimonadetes bacterium]|nr:hypothetical protein [Gemmatimonadota bacterium]
MRALILRKFLLATLSFFIHGCGGEAVPVVMETGVDSVEAETPGEWVTLLQRGMATRSTRPERFLSTTTRLRVITDMGPNQTVHNVGFVMTNIMSDNTTLPVASVRAQQFRLDISVADTTEITVPEAGPLYFFVAEHRRLPDWHVTIQEYRPGSSN